MIQGDVDLTTNLDFYRDKSDKKNKSSHGHSLVPWQKESFRAKDKSLSPIDPYKDSKFRFINNDINYILNSGYFDTEPSWTSLRAYYESDNVTGYLSTRTSASMIDITSSYTTTYSSNWISIRSNNDLDNFNQTFTFYSIPTDDYEVSWIDEYSGVITKPNYGVKVTYEPSEDQPSIFGPRRIREPMKSLLTFNSCCGTYSIGDCKKCKKKMKVINDSKYDSLFHGKFFKQQRHQEKLDDNSYDVLDLLKNDKRKDKIDEEKYKRRIPWLRKLSERIYNDYISDLFEENDYSDYLTNMNWLRIRR